MERTSSEKLDEMVSIQKSASDRIGLGYDLSSSSTTVFVPPANIIETENNDVKNELASENIDKGKSVLEAPPKLLKMRLKTIGLRRETLKSLNRKSSISIINMD